MCAYFARPHLGYRLDELFRCWRFSAPHVQRRFLILIGRITIIIPVVVLHGCCHPFSPFAMSGPKRREKPGYLQRAHERFGEASQQPFAGEHNKDTLTVMLCLCLQLLEIHLHARSVILIFWTSSYQTKGVEPINPECLRVAQQVQVDTLEARSLSHLAFWDEISLSC
jgi:hypothetical protein